MHSDRAGRPRLDRESGQIVFETDAVGYHAGRIGYPDTLFERLFARAASAPDILEIGAGTGLATEAMLARKPRSLTVVEPGGELIAFMRGRMRAPNLTFVNAAFPDVVLDDQYDIIACAAAFHWLEPTAALARVRSLLRPGGVWAMWWNSYRNTNVGDPLSDAVTPLLDGISLPPSEGPDGHYSLDMALHTRTLVNAGFGEVEYQLFRRERTLDAAQVRALYASYSYIRLLPEARRRDLLDKIEHLVEDRFAGQAPNVVLTAFYSAVPD